MIALADCNNFYASCEAVFDPRIAGRPLVVLGNNDGNIIARSQAAKDLGIPMGAALHQVREVVDRHGVVVRSANFALYGDLSLRVMETLGCFAPRMNVYSIDEAFLDVAAVPAANRVEVVARMRSTVKRWTGIPVSVGVAKTKTLAKAAADRAKKLPEGVYVLDTDERRDALLQSMVVEDVWGIGERRGAVLRRHGIASAYELMRADYGWVKRALYVPVAKTLLELRGVACLPLETAHGPRKQLCVSRSFGREVRELAVLREAVAAFAARAAQKVRAQRTKATTLMIFIHTNPFRSVPQYSRSATVSFAGGTYDTIEIVRAAGAAVERIYRPGYGYHKGGAILGGLVPDEPGQLALFAPGPDREPVLRVMDLINARFGRDTIRPLATGTRRAWRMKQANRSPRYTTRWAELAETR
jgi:DNA polymerase V